MLNSFFFFPSFLRKLCSIKLQSTKIWDLTIKGENIIFIVQLHFIFLDYPSMSAATLSPHKQEAFHVTWEIENF